MMPWKEQIRAGWRILRWMYWADDYTTWARILMLISGFTVVLSIVIQFWVGLTAAILLLFVAVFAGKKGD